MGFLLDAAVILILGICLYSGYRRGFVRGLVGIIGTIAAVIIAGLLSAPVAEVTYNAFLATPSQRTIEERMPDLPTPATTAVAIDDYLAELPEAARELLTQGGCGNGDKIVATLPQTAFADKTALAREITAKVVRPTIMPLISGICFILLFILLLVLVQCVAHAVNKVFELPVLRSFNHMGGLLVGLVQGLLWVIALVTVIQLYALYHETGFIKPADLQDSLLTDWFAAHNPIAHGIAAAASKLIG